MNETQWTIIDLVIGFFIVLIGLYFGFKSYLKQAQTNLRRSRAHAGKVRCEDEKEDCNSIATRVTPNGYFCDIHWLENSRRLTSSALVSWSHILNHVLKGRS